MSDTKAIHEHGVEFIAPDGGCIACCRVALAQAERERDAWQEDAKRYALNADAARAEVERLKAVNDGIWLQGPQARAEQADADLARVRAALDGTHFHHKAYEPECSHCRAALEGRG